MRQIPEIKIPRRAGLHQLGMQVNAQIPENVWRNSYDVIAKRLGISPVTAKHITICALGKLAWLARQSVQHKS